MSKTLHIPKSMTGKARRAKCYALACASLMTALSMTSISAHAAGLNDLFSNSAAQSKFLPVDEAFQVSANCQLCTYPMR